MGLSQQYDLQLKLSRITFYVLEGWLLGDLLLYITPPDFYSDARTTELEIRVRPADLLERTRRQRSSLFFAETTTLTLSKHLLRIGVEKILDADWYNNRHMILNYR